MLSIADRTFNFAIRIVRLCKYLNEQPGVPRILANQLLRSGTSIGANTTEAKSGQSRKDFLHKLEIALKEARETEYWLKLLVASDTLPPDRVTSLLEEIDEIIKILVSITKKVKHTKLS
ncbi:MAG: four helix bundle protein [Cyanobacteria bacterium P01_H01_bin.58]